MKEVNNYLKLLFKNISYSNHFQLSYPLLQNFKSGFLAHSFILKDSYFYSFMH